MTYCLLSFHFARTQPSSHQPSLIYLIACYPLIVPGLLLTYLPACTMADFTCSARVFVNVTTNAQPSKRSLLTASFVTIPYRHPENQGHTVDLLTKNYGFLDLQKLTDKSSRQVLTPQFIIMLRGFLTVRRLYHS